MVMTEDQVKYMVERFLQWKLPKSFNPDGGIEFKRTVESGGGTFFNAPIGTNLFSFTEAKEMVEFMIEGLEKVSFNVGKEFEKLMEEADNPKIVKDLMIGRTLFRKGVEYSTVQACAARLWEAYVDEGKRVNELNWEIQELKRKIEDAEKK